MGGDFNVHPDSQEFAEIRALLRTYNTSLLSSVQIPTFCGRKNGYRLDYTFASFSFSLAQVTVLDVHCSDHLPLQVLVKTPRKLSSFECTESTCQAIDLDTCSTLLEDQDLLSLPAAEIPMAIDKIFKSASKKIRPKKKSKNWFDYLAYELRIKCAHLHQMSKTDSSFRNDYFVARSAYHAHLRQLKKQYYLNQANSMIDNAKTSGLKALYKHAKTFSPSSSIPLSNMTTYCRDLFSSGSNGGFQAVPGCEDPCNPVIKPINCSEMSGILNRLRSKAKSANNHASPYFLKLLCPTIVPLLCKVFNWSLTSGMFPNQWCESVLFFIHKKGPHSDPSNYRSICIENPFLKAFMSLLASRFSTFAEDNDLLPPTQFGFRRGLSCLTATSLLHNLVYTRLKNRAAKGHDKATYACFVDFQKAFDSIDRSILLTKLQLMGFPTSICALLFKMFSSLQIYIRARDVLSPSFTTTLGTPQGLSLIHI